MVYSGITRIGVIIPTLLHSKSAGHNTFCITIFQKYFIDESLNDEGKILH